jgi:hypothetical protein
MSTIAGLGLGRVFDVIPIAAGKGFSLQNANAVDFVCTGDGSTSVFTLTVATTFAGTYRAYTYFIPYFTPFAYYYGTTATDGTAAWQRVSMTAASVITPGTTGTPGATLTTAVITLFSTEMPDGYSYVKMTNSGGAGLVTAVLHDLSVARKPANLKILGA